MYDVIALFDYGLVISGDRASRRVNCEEQRFNGRCVWRHDGERETAVVKKSGDWWIGWIEEVPGVNGQEHTRDDLLESLRMTLGEVLDFNRRDALEAAGEGYEEESIAL